jgi:hypothetical protein
MQMFTLAERQGIGCGLAPAVERPFPWMHPGYKGPPPEHCIGYTRQLPEVIEVAKANFFAEKGNLAAFTGPSMHSHLQELVIVMSSEVSQMNSWRMENPKKDR